MGENISFLLNRSILKEKGKELTKMIETVFPYALGDEKKVEKLIDHPVAMINHMVFPKDQGLPEHYSNSNVYMIVIRGTLSIRLDEQEPHEYAAGNILTIPYHVKMNVGNSHDEVLELFVIKAPTPSHYKEEPSLT